MLGPQDVVHLAAVWNEQLERYNIPEAVFDRLADRIVDRRLRYIQRYEQPPTASIELVLAVFTAYREEVEAQVQTSEKWLESHEREMRYVEDIANSGDAERAANYVKMAEARGSRSETLDDIIADIRQEHEKELLKMEATMRKSGLFTEDEIVKRLDPASRIYAHVLPPSRRYRTDVEGSIEQADAVL